MIIDPGSISNAQVFEWCYQHIGLIIWPLCIRYGWKFMALLISAKETAAKAVEQVDKMATDHFPAMRTSLATQDKALESAAQSLSTLVQNQMQFSTAQPAKRRK